MRTCGFRWEALGEDCLIEPGRPVVGGLSLQLDGREDLYPRMN
jgi:hypothetical protein